MPNNFVEQENALPKEIVIRRVCEGGKIPQCFWTVEIKTWKKGKFEGVISDYFMKGFFKRYKPFMKYPKFVLKDEQNAIG